MPDCIIGCLCYCNEKQLVFLLSGTALNKGPKSDSFSTFKRTRLSFISKSAAACEKIVKKVLLIFQFLLFQKTCQSATEVKQRAEKLIKDGHFDPEAIWNCADNMSRRWQQLMNKSEERKKVVTASCSFFKSVEQVMK